MTMNQCNAESGAIGSRLIKVCPIRGEHERHAFTTPPRAGFVLVPCDGEAHSNPHIDNCGHCAPRWGWIETRDEGAVSGQQIREEFERQSEFLPTNATCEKMAVALNLEGIEFGDVGVASAVIGYLCARGRK
jgi:hypothetical protein